MIGLGGEPRIANALRLVLRHLLADKKHVGEDEHAVAIAGRSRLPHESHSPFGVLRLTRAALQLGQCQTPHGATIACLRRSLDQRPPFSAIRTRPRIAVHQHVAKCVHRDRVALRGAHAQIAHGFHAIGCESSDTGEIDERSERRLCKRLPGVRSGFEHCQRTRYHPIVVGLEGCRHHLEAPERLCIGIALVGCGEQQRHATRRIGRATDAVDEQFAGVCRGFDMLQGRGREEESSRFGSILWNTVAGVLHATKQVLRVGVTAGRFASKSRRRLLHRFADEDAIGACGDDALWSGGCAAPTSARGRCRSTAGP